MREDGASTDGEEDYEDGSSRLGSQRSTCDTDSTHDMDLDSPRPLDPPRLPFGQHHSPLSPLMPEEEEVEVVVDTTGQLDLSFPPPPSAPSSTLPLLAPPSSISSLLRPSMSSPLAHPSMSSPLSRAPMSSPLAHPSMSSPLAHPSLSSTPIKVERPLALAMSSPSLAAT